MSNKGPEKIRPTCLRPGCGRASQKRGLCIGDYRAAEKFVADGETTWELLEANGKVKGLKGKTTDEEARKFFLGVEARTDAERGVRT